MPVQDFEEICENEGWEEDEEDEDDKMEQALSFDGLMGLSAEWKCLLHAAAALTLDSYSEDVETEAAGGSGSSGWTRQQREESSACALRSEEHPTALATAHQTYILMHGFHKHSYMSYVVLTLHSVVWRLKNPQLICVIEFANCV